QVCNYKFIVYRIKFQFKYKFFPNIKIINHIYYSIYATILIVAYFFADPLQYSVSLQLSECFNLGFAFTL
ncbi:hypothetical protein BRR55_25875, partial [Salmonella enterica]|nr:hypothetical protein [Salmonella enterica]